MQPLCSIIVPTYDAAPYLEAALDSALGQTYQSVEVVVVDDGSTDETPAILERYDRRIVTTWQVNAGVSAARNTGLALASGELIAYLNADDVFEPTRIARCVEALDADPAITAVTTDAYMIDETGTTGRRWYGGFSDAVFAEDDQLQAIVRANYVFVSVVVRRAALEAAGPFDSACDRAEDLDMWIRLLLGGARFACIPETLAGCRLRADSLLADPSKQWDAHLHVLDKHAEALWARGVRVPAPTYFELAKRHARAGARRRAFAFARMGMRGRDLQLARRARAAAGVARRALR